MGFAGHTQPRFPDPCAGEVFDKLDVAYIVGLEARGLSPTPESTWRAGSESLRVTNYSLSVRFKAAAAGVSFYRPANHGHDTFQYSGSKIIQCPYTGPSTQPCPPSGPSRGIHVHEADIYGNCRIRGITFRTSMCPCRQAPSLPPSG